MPDLPVELRHESHRLPCMGLVDSGGKISVLPYSLGVQLGLDWTAQSAHISLGGTLSHPCMGDRGRGSSWAASPGAIGVSLGRVGSSSVFVGQFNFFQAFDVCFFREQSL